MDKLKMAHDYFMGMISRTSVTLREENLHSIRHNAWQYADAMQAEADERKKAEAAQKRKEIREMLNADNTFIEREGQHFDDVADVCKTYSSSEALCQVDWRQAPSDAAAYIKLSDWDIGAWVDELGIQIEDAPSFGFTGTHIVERPQ